MLIAKEVRMSNLTGVGRVMRCDHTESDACAKRGPGHALHPIQARAAAATPSKWVDGIVRCATSDGWIGVNPIGLSDTIWAWHHESVAASLSAGTPVAVHQTYQVLASGSARLSIITL